MKSILSKKQVSLVLFILLTYNLFPQIFVEQTGIDLTGVYQSSVEWGDYDNDGDLDISLTSYHGDMGVTIVYKTMQL